MADDQVRDVDFLSDGQGRLIATGYGVAGVGEKRRAPRAGDEFECRFDGRDAVTYRVMRVQPDERRPGHWIAYLAHAEMLEAGAFDDD